MTSIQIDRTDGLSSSVAIKGPCRAATTANITLSGGQTIDGVSVVTDDRVLVKNQTSTSENGIYVVDTGAWRRAKDFSRSNDIVVGTQIFVTSGTLYSQSGWLVSTFTSVGGAAIVFTQNVLVNGAALAALEASAQAASDAAEVAQALAEAAAATINLPAIAANRMIVDNAAGTLRESKTFPQVRALLETPSYDDLLYIDGMANGLTGNSGDDQTTELQNIIDNIVPAEGGIIKYRGYVDFTTIDLYGRRNIVFQGEGGNGAGAAQRSILRSTAGAIGSGVPAIKMWKTFGIGFEKTMIQQTDAAFNGVLLDFNDTTPAPGDDSALMHIRDVCIYGASASGTLLDLYGSTQGSFQNTTFSGAAKMVALQTSAGVPFANQHGFDRCSFTPTGTVNPVVGSGDAITFSGCNIQASSGDGKMRFIQTGLSQPFNNIALLNNSFYDATAGGVETCVFYWGNGLTIIGNRFTNYTGSYDMTLGGGGSGVDPQLDGLRGFIIEGNSFYNGTAHVNFAGTIGNKKNPRGGSIIGNSVTNGNLLSNYSLGEAIEVGPNSIYSAPNAFGAQKSYIGLYQYADRAAAIVGGLTTGQAYQETTSGQRYLCIV